MARHPTAAQNPSPTLPPQAAPSSAAATSLTTRSHSSRQHATHINTASQPQATPRRAAANSAPALGSIKPPKSAPQSASKHAPVDGAFARSYSSLQRARHATHIDTASPSQPAPRRPAADSASAPGSTKPPSRRPAIETTWAPQFASKRAPVDRVFARSSLIAPISRQLARHATHIDTASPLQAAPRRAAVDSAFALGRAVETTPAPQSASKSAPVDGVFPSAPQSGSNRAPADGVFTRSYSSRQLARHATHADTAWPLQAAPRAAADSVFALGRAVEAMSTPQSASKCAPMDGVFARSSLIAPLSRQLARGAMYIGSAAVLSPLSVCRVLRLNHGLPLQAARVVS